MIVLTSFKKAHLFRGDKFSIARFQPKGFDLPTLEFFSANDKNGQPLRLESFISPISGYEKAYLEAVREPERWHKIQEWLVSLKNERDLILCCWCPYSDSSKDWLKEMGVFACHSGIIGQLINKTRPDIQIILDADRKKHLIREWIPVNLYEDEF